MPRWTEAADPDFVGVLALAVEPSVVEQLGLTDNQRSQLRQLIDAQEYDLVGLLQQWKTLPAPERIEKLRAFRQAAEAKGLAFLSKQQAEKLLRLGRQRKGPALLAEAEVAERLELTPEQRSQIAALLKDQAARKGSSDERAVEAARADAERKVAGILSASQRAAWATMIQSGPAGPGTPSEVSPPVPAPKSANAGPAEKTAVGPVKPEAKPEAKPETKPEAKPEAKPSEAAAEAPDEEDVDGLMQDLLGESGAEPPAPKPGTPGFGMPGAPGIPPFGMQGPPGTPSGVRGFPGAKWPPGATPPQFGQMPPRKPAERLKFNFSGMPWKDVIQWFADQNALALQGENYPTGSFTYTDDKEYTPAEALDLLNSVLLAKDYTLVRKDRMLWVLAVNEFGPGTIPPYMVDEVTVEDLDKRGNYEFVRVFFPVEGVSPEEAQAEIRPLVVLPGSVVTLAKARLLLVTDTVARLKTIRRVLKDIEQPANLVEIHEFRIDPQEGVKMLAPLMGIPANATSTADGSFAYTLDASGTRLIMTGKPEKLRQAKGILDKIDPRDPNNPRAGVANGPPELKTYPVTADPDTAYKVVATMMQNEPGLMISPDPKTGSLLVFARPAQHAKVRAIIDEMQQPTARRIEVIQLRVLDPQVTVLAITKMFVTGQGPTAPTVDADPVKRQLLVRGSEGQIAQIKEFLKNMGEVAGTEAGNGSRNVIVLPPISPRVSRSALEQLQQMWPQLRRNPIRVVTSPGSIPQVFPNGPPEAKAIDENGFDLPESPDQAPGMSEDMLEFYRQLRDADVTLPSYRPTVPSLSRQTPERGQPSTSGRRGRGGPEGPFGPGGRGGPGSGEFQRGERPSGPPPMMRDRSTAVPPPASRQGPRYFLVAAQQPKDETPRQGPPPELKGSGPSAQPPKAAAGPIPQRGTTPLSKSQAGPSPEKGKPGAANRKGPARPSDGTEEGAPVYVGIGPGGVVIASDDPEALDEFERLFNMLLSMGPPGQSEMTIFYLKYAKAISVADTLDSIFGGGTLSGGGGGTLLGDIAGSALNEMGGGVLGTMLGLGGDGGGGRRAGAPLITADSRLNALFVQADPVDLDMIEQLLKILDRPGSPETTAVEAKPRLIPVFNTQAQEVADVVRQVYSERLTGQGAGAGRPPNPQEFLQALANARGGGRGGGGRGGRRQQEELPKMSIGVDYRTNCLIVAAPDALFQEVEALVKQLDEGAIDSNQTYTVVRLKGGTSPAAVQLALQSMMGSQAQVTRRSAGGQSGFGTGTMPGGFGPQMGMGGQFGGGMPFGGGGGFTGRGGFQPGGGGGFQGGGRFGGGGPTGGGFPGGGGFSPGGGGGFPGGGGMGGAMGGGRGGGGMGGGGRGGGGTGGGGRGGGRGGRGGG